MGNLFDLKLLLVECHAIFGDFFDDLRGAFFRILSELEKDFG